MASKNEEEIRKISVELRMLEQTAEALQSRLSMLNAVTQDLTYANMTLESLEKEKENSELLVPIGGTSYIRARLDNPDKIIVGIGAGVSVEKTRQEAKDVIKKRLEDLEKARTSTQQQFAQVAERINEDRERFEDLAATVRGEKSSQNV
ncbi:MAG TPA: prefoldin subunit alpha [candidate division Zixibacteria bacterium]|nr:prefoldin subunit alpha [candidate division Zixibacteria bacterium]